MNKKILSMLLGVVGVILVAAGSFYIFMVRKPEIITTTTDNKSVNENKTETTPPVKTDPTPTPPTIPPVTDPIPPAPPKDSTFENKYFKLTLQSGWIASGSKSVNIIKGNYIFYINPMFEHASGIEGGRFNEVTDGMPSLDLVMKNVVKPSTGTECATTTPTTITSKLSITNYYTDSSKTGNSCNFPTGATPRWFGTVTSGDAAAVFGRPTGTESTNDFAITVAYKTTILNNLPIKDSTELKQMLDEVALMLKTLQFKHL